MKAVQSMLKYSVHYYQGNEEKIWGETHHFGNADRTAQELSLESGVSEVLVYDNNGELIRVYVNGNDVDTTDYQLNDMFRDIEVDEIGYNPYIGCCDNDC